MWFCKFYYINPSHIIFVEQALVLAFCSKDPVSPFFHHKLSTAHTNLLYTSQFPEFSRCQHAVLQTKSYGPSARSHTLFGDILWLSDREDTEVRRRFAKNHWLSSKPALTVVLRVLCLVPVEGGVCKAGTL